MEAKSIREKVMEVLEEQLGPFRIEVTDTTTFDELGADSLDKVEMVMQLEEAYAISVSDENLEQMKTVADIVSYLEAKTGAGK